MIFQIEPLVLNFAEDSREYGTARPAVGRNIEIESGLSPDKLFETLLAYQPSAALKAAIELDLFTAIGERGNTARSLATRIGSSERGVRMLCDSMVVIALLTKIGERYGLTAVRLVSCRK